MKALLRQCFFISIITEDFALKRTTNYALPTWEKSDFIQMSDFNDLTQKTDAALKANADAIGEKAAAAALEALAQNLGVHGHNARVTWGSYTGAGTYGASNQNSLEFGFCPVLVAITCDELGHYPAAPSILLRGAGLAPTLTAASGGSMGAEYTALRPTWGDSGVSWYSEKSVACQLNESGITYFYVVIGYDKAKEEE